jgi:predicted RND superfamily exporter protein
MLAIGLVIATLGALPFLRQALIPNNSIFTWTDQSGPAVASYLKFRKQFGNDETLFVGVKKNARLTGADLAELGKFTAEARQVAGVDKVHSLTDLDFLRHDSKAYRDYQEWRHGDGTVVEKILESPVMRGLFVNDAGDTVLVWIELSDAANAGAERREALDSLRALAVKTFAGKRVALGGVPLMYADLNDVTKRDAFVLLGVASLLLLGVFFAVVKSRGVALGLALILVLTLITTFGLYGAFGGQLNVLVSLAPILLVVLGVEVAIHFAVADRMLRDLGLDRDEHTVAVLGRCFMPCFITSITTVLGFLSLTSSSIKTIQQFGVVSALGMLFAFAATVVVFLFLTRINHASKVDTRLEAFIAKCLHAFSLLLARRFRVAVGVVVVATAAFALLSLRVQPDTDLMAYLPPASVTRQDHEWLESHWGSYMLYDFVIEQKAGAPVYSLDAQRRVEEFFEAISANRDYGRGASLSGIYRWLGGVSLDNGYVLDEAAYDEAQDVLARESGSPFPSFLSNDRTTARFSLRMKNSTAQELLGREKIMQAEMAKRFGDAYTVHKEGLLSLYGETVAEILSSQVSNLISGSLFTLGIMFFWLRSVRLVVIGVIPSFFTILVIFAYMGLTGIALDIPTSVVASITVGVSIDNTIHFLIYCNSAEAEGKSWLECLQSAFDHAGVPAVVLSLLLMISLPVFALSEIARLRDFGVLMAVGSVAAVGANFLVLPLLLRWWGPKQRDPKPQDGKQGAEAA